MDGRTALVTPVLVLVAALLVAVATRDVRRRDTGTLFVGALRAGSPEKAVLLIALIALIALAWWW